MVAQVARRIATGRRAGQRMLRVGDCIDPDDLPALEGKRCASVSGVSLHANVAVPARDRRRLERLCRYVARPPVATERLSRREGGRLPYRLKHHWHDGTTHFVFEPQELVDKLAALVPPPRFHRVRYHGILGPCASERDRVVPGPPEPLEPALRPRRLAWAELLRRVFAVDLLECPRCGGRMRLLAAIQPPDVTRAILDCLELSSRAPPTAPAVPDTEEWAADSGATL